MTRATAACRPSPARGRPPGAVLGAALALLMGACTAPPLLTRDPEVPPLILAPTTALGIADRRARFREIYCAVADARADAAAACATDLVRIAGEGPPSGAPVHLGPSRTGLRVLLVPGLGWDCIRDYLYPPADDPTDPLGFGFEDRIGRFGFALAGVPLDGLAGSARNAVPIRDAVRRYHDESPRRPLVLVGYSKGLTDILEALYRYPELVPRVDAVVALAGLVGGTPLANVTSDRTLGLYRLVPGAECSDVSDEAEALADMTTAVRKRALSDRPLPEGVRYYSLVTRPEPERISFALRASYHKLGQVDPRNDSQITVYDQVLPRGSLLGYLNADHVAIAVPIDRTSPTLARTLFNRNAFPRETLLEALVRLIEEDLLADEPPP